MKSTPDQAIYDFSSAIYRLVALDFEKVNKPIVKSQFLMECLVLIGELKLITIEVVVQEQTIQFLVSDSKYIFWLVEVPEPSEKWKFLDYLSAEITKIFYNLNLNNCNR